MHGHRKVVGGKRDESIMSCDVGSPALQKMAGGSIVAEFHGRGTYLGTSKILRGTGRYDLPPPAEEE